MDWIIYGTDDDCNVIFAKPFKGTKEEVDEECDFWSYIIGEEVSFTRYTEKKWNRLKRFYKPSQQKSDSTTR